MQKILIIEDEKKIADWIQIYLENAGFCTITAHDGSQGLEKARKESPDLILLDLMLPKIRGEEVCSRIRKSRDVPIIILTAKNTKKDLLDSLNEGADDYITKPFDPEELIGRIKAVLRRARNQTVKILQCGPMDFNRETGQVSINGEEVVLSQAQLSILEVFMTHPNIILSRAQIIETAFADQFSGYDRAIDNHIKRIRQIINKNGFKPIKTIYGGGYKLECR